jgi:hypothetical protein
LLYPHPWTEARKRVLEYDLDSSTQRPQHPARDAVDPPAGETDRAGGDIDETKDASTDSRFPATRLADQSERLAAKYFLRSLTSRSGALMRRPPPSRHGGRRRGDAALSFRFLDLVAGIHHHHARRYFRHYAEVVGDEDDGGADPFFQVAEQIENLCLDRHVECGRGLVRDEQFRIAGKRNRDHHPLPHAETGKRRKKATSGDRRRGRASLR